METEKQLKEHDKLLKKHQYEIEDLKEDVSTVKQSINNTLIQVNESNRFLREQNRDILTNVLKGNETKKRRDYNIEKINIENKWKLILASFTSGGFIITLISLLIRYLG